MDLRFRLVRIMKKVAGGADDVIKFVVVAVGALGERVAAAAGITFFGAGRTFVKLDDIFDVREFAVGVEIVVLDGFCDGDVLDGAVFHENTESFVAEGLAEFGENDVGWLAGKAEDVDVFGARFGVGDMEILELVGGFGFVPVD